ncbi:hypothetical protein BDP27DRAFT_1428549 [Rhodocollybia butyracea]|uniref:Uncharacterized protein n=1 Tax=Rhodocollybia butyracea TaxID=206335 RepID=A0A9P5PFK7_9AGAR|nr:hypothetical protein BDP27DRAFT_1428549 [Rhodocollybia butyracea]
MAFTPVADVPRLVVVDDTDPTIRYSPSSAFSLDTTGSLNNLGWGGNVFNQTITGTTVNASLSYTFNGTFVRAMIAGNLDHDGPKAYGWNCSVDGHSIISFVNDANPTQVANYIACDSAGTLQGTTSQHTLNVNFYFLPNTNSTSNQSLWLDSIQYQPLPSDPLDSVTIRIDNSDPSVRFSNVSGTWQRDPTYNLTQTTGTSMDFSFNGSSVTLYSLVFTPNNTGGYNANMAFYSIDGNSTSFVLPGSMITSSTGDYETTSNCPFFTVSNLSTSPHDIQVATSYNSSTSPQFLAIDYFLIKTHPHNSTSSTSGSSHKNVGAIVGSTVAGIAGLAALFLFWFLRRQKERSKYSGTMLAQTGRSPFAYDSQLIPTEASDCPASPQAAVVQEEQDRRNEIRRSEIRRNEIRRDEIMRYLDSGVRIPSADDAISDSPRRIQKNETATSIWARTGFH